MDLLLNTDGLAVFANSLALPNRLSLRLSMGHQTLMIEQLMVGALLSFSCTIVGLGPAEGLLPLLLRTDGSVEVGLMEAGFTSSGWAHRDLAHFFCRDACTCCSRGNAMELF